MGFTSKNILELLPSEEIKATIKKKYGTQRKVAELLGLTEANLGMRIKKPTMSFIKDLLSIGISFPQFEAPDLIHPKGHFYKLIKSIDAGEPALIYREDNIEDEIFFEYPTSERCFCLRVQGDSMTNGNGKSIKEDDIVLVDMNVDVIPGDVVVVSLLNGREMIKRYFPREDDIILKSDNPKYPDIIVKPDDIQAMYKAVRLQPKIILL